MGSMLLPSLTRIELTHVFIKWYRKWESGIWSTLFRKLKFLDMGGEQQLLNRGKIFVKEVSEGWFLKFRVRVIGFRNVFGNFSVFVSSQVVPLYFLYLPLNFKKKDVMRFRLSSTLAKFYFWCHLRYGAHIFSQNFWNSRASDRSLSSLPSIGVR